MPPRARWGRRVLYQWTQAAVSCVGFQSGWFPSNVARNSRAHISDIEMWSLKLQRLWPISKNDHVKLRATFAGVVTVVTFRSLYSPGVVPVDPGGGFTFDLAPIAPRGRPHPGDPPRDHTNAATNSPILTLITAHRPQLISATSTTTHHTNSGLIQAIHTHHLIVTPPRLILLLTTALRPRPNHASSTTRRTSSTTPGDTATRTRTTSLNNPSSTTRRTSTTTPGDTTTRTRTTTARASLT